MTRTARDVPHLASRDAPSHGQRARPLAGGALPPARIGRGRMRATAPAGGLAARAAKRHDMPRAALSLRHDAARRAAEPGGRLLGRGQGRGSPRRSTGSGSTMSRAAGRGRTRPTAPSSRRRRGSARARLAAFGMTKRAGRSAANDEVLAAVLNAGTPAVCLVGKTHDFHVAHRARGRARGEPRQHRASRSAHRRGAGPRGAVRRRAFLRRLEGRTRAMRSTACAAALDAGARWVVLCDTNGGTLPAEVGRDHRRRWSRPASPATGSASTPTTTPATRWRTRSRRSTPGRGRCRAR